MSKPIAKAPGDIQHEVMTKLQVHVDKIKSIRLNAEYELVEWINGLSDEQFKFLPATVSWEILGGRHYLLIPVTDEQLTVTREFGLINVHTKADKELNIEELLQNYVSDSFIKNGCIKPSVRRIIVAWSVGSYPYIFDAHRGSDTLTISITGPEALFMDDEKFLELYVNVNTRDVPPHDRESIDKAYQYHEEGPDTSTDEMFQEVSEAVQEAVREEIEPLMPERCTMATTESGRYAVEVYREFPDREAALNFMKAQLEL
ncbi:hypothetical protein [Vibrio phage pTD1]|uniref:Uncharacterized protein n=1 Tax=Vibrio phage pTD1 TaxID=1938577 RepID=A0A1Q2U2T0_9CAUD|nr:hypothetical protein FDH33_gp059 [Vibrio phage pTD1]BAW98268.1 hypothetical protein [Vibrio phage pTD1]